MAYVVLYVVFLIDGVWWVDPNYPPVTVHSVQQCEKLKEFFHLQLDVIQTEEFKMGCQVTNDVWGFLADTYGQRPYKGSEI